MLRPAAFGLQLRSFAALRTCSLVRSLSRACFPWPLRTRDTAARDTSARRNKLPVTRTVCLVAALPAGGLGVDGSASRRRFDRLRLAVQRVFGSTCRAQLSAVASCPRRPCACVRPSPSRCRCAVPSCASRPSDRSPQNHAGRRARLSELP